MGDRGRRQPIVAANAAGGARGSLSAVLAVCFFLSGATGLVYQVVWLRMLVLIFGHTVHAVTTVLAAFMAGLALGSLLWGRQARRVRDPISAYGWLEIGIGAYGGLMPALLWLVSSLYLDLRHRLAPDMFGAIQFLGMFCLLLIPTTLMGGTLPVLSQALVRSETGLTRTVGTLYAVNTFGAALGTALAGYALLPAVGNRTTIAVAAVTNVAVGLLALLYSRRHRRTERVAASPPMAPAVVETSEAPGVTEARDWGARFTIAAIGVSGAISMVYEVAWTRALALVIGSSTYAFTAMLLAFLIGIAGGSALYAWLWGGRRTSPATFAAIQAAIALAVTAIVLLFERMPELFLMALSWSTSPVFVQLVELVISVCALLLSTLFIGATFPCALAVAARVGHGAGETVGHVYAVNTLGAIAGAMLAGFLLIPALGVHASIKVGIVTNLLLAALLLPIVPRPVSIARWSAVAGTLTLAAGASVIPPWNPGVMSSGPAIYGAGALRWTGREGFARAVGRTSLLYYRDGLSSTVSVHREGQQLFLRVNGKTDAGTGGDMQTQFMLGHLPLLVHPRPERVLVIGLGSGITAGAAARHPVERLDIAEIEPTVVVASRFFTAVNGDVLHDPRVHTVITDGRNHLLTEGDRYDVIISEPSNPWISGLASLFSVEFFQLARSRLRPGGIMTQWVQAYDLLPDDLRMIANSFHTIFPHTSVWGNTGGDFLLLGQVEPRPLDLTLIRGRYESNAGVRKDLERIRILAWPNLLGQFVLDERGLALLVEGAGLNTDDRLPLEFSAPRTLYAQTAARNRELMRSFRTAALPEVTPESRAELARAEVRFGIGMGFWGQDLPEDALAQLGEALRLDPQHTPSLFWASAIYVQQGRPADALPLLRKVHDLDPANAQAFLLAGAASLALNAPKDAVGFLERAASLDPSNRETRVALNQARLAASRSGP